MRNAASVLGLIGGLIALVVGFAAYGYTELLYRWGEIPNWAELPENADRVRGTSVIAPLLALVGGAIAQNRALAGGGLLLVAAGALYWAFGLGVFTIFPIAMCGLGGVLAILSPYPDAPKSHGR